MITTVKFRVFCAMNVAQRRVTVYNIVLSLSTCTCHDKAVVARDRHLATAQVVCLCVCEREREQSRESPALRPQAAAAFTVCLNASTTLDLAAKHTLTHKTPMLKDSQYYCSHLHTHTHTCKHS